MDWLGLPWTQKRPEALILLGLPAFFGLAWSFDWWRWRGSNPRPSVRCHWFYMLSRLYWFNPLRPERQGVEGDSLSFSRQPRDKASDDPMFFAPTSPAHGQAGSVVGRVLGCQCVRVVVSDYCFETLF